MSYPISLLLILLMSIPMVVPTPPNFMVIMLDDMEYIADWDHSYGTMGTNLKGEQIEYPSVSAPNIMNFLNDGSIIIPRTYAASATCSPSRYSLLT
eukprot:850200_1